MRPRLSRALLGVALVLAVAGCDEIHDDDDIVVTSQVLTARGDACVVVGTIANRTGDTLRVFLAFRALDGDDDLIGTADAEVREVQIGGKTCAEAAGNAELGVCVAAADPEGAEGQAPHAGRQGVRRVAQIGLLGGTQIRRHPARDIGHRRRGGLG